MESLKVLFLLIITSYQSSKHFVQANLFKAYSRDFVWEFEDMGFGLQLSDGYDSPTLPFDRTYLVVLSWRTNDGQHDPHTA
jgi:hypothetical protein